MSRDIRTALADATARLAATSESAAADAEILLAHVLGCTRTKLRAWPERGVNDTADREFEALIERRARGEPVAYLTGRREFWSLNLEVTPDTLIPRPETELLVELALERIPADRPARVADLGTGSGAIALAIASERPLATVVATDTSAAALGVARRNAQRFGIHNVEFREGPWCEPLADEAFDMIVSNPPYVAEGDPHLIEGDVRFEPRRALAAGEDGLDDLRVIAACARSRLLKGGWLLLEHGCDQGAAVANSLAFSGYVKTATYTDLSGQARISVGQERPEEPL